MDAADLHIANQVTQLVVRLAVGARERRVQRRDEKLADLLVERHLFQRVIDPLCRGGIERALCGRGK